MDGILLSMFHVKHLKPPYNTKAFLLYEFFLNFTYIFTATLINFLRVSISFSSS